MKLLILIIILTGFIGTNHVFASDCNDGLSALAVKRRKNAQIRQRLQSIRDSLFSAMSQRIDERTWKRIERLLINADNDPRTPEKLARVLGIKYLLHKTSISATRNIIQDGELVSGKIARERHLVIPGLGEITRFEHERIFLEAIDDAWNGVRVGPMDVFLYFDLSLLNRADAGFQRLWNHGSRFASFQDDPLSFVAELLGRFPKNEASFSEPIPLDYLKRIVVPKKRHTAPRHMNPNTWEVPLFEIQNELIDAGIDVPRNFVIELKRLTVE